MRRHAQRVRWLVTVAALALGSTAVWADGGDDCFQRRPRTAAERQLAQDVIAALKRALPAAPAGWQLADVTEPRAPRDTLAVAKGCLESHAIKATYRNESNALAGAQHLSANAGRMESLMAELQAALAQGDAKRMKELNAEMTQLQSGIGGGNGGSLMVVGIEVNVVGMGGPDAKAQPLSLPGVPLAFRRGSGAQTQVTLYLGDSWQPQGRGAVMRLRKDLANADAQMMLVTVNGESAEAFARRVDVAALKAVLK